MEKHDVIIIGGGPAALMCARYLKLANIDYKLITSILGGALFQATNVFNFPTHKQIEGSLIATEMVEATDIDCVEFDEVVNYKNHIVTCKSGAEFFGKAIVIASGSNPIKLSIGSDLPCIHYCVLCDSYLYRDKTVVVLGGGESAVQSAIFLSSICNDVYVVFRKDDMKICSYSRELLKKKGNIYLYSGKVLDDITSTYSNKYNFIFSSNHGEPDFSLIVDGCFVCYGSTPATTFLKNSDIQLNEKGYVLHGFENKPYTATTEDGCFVAGDCMANIYRQIVISIGNGATCALDVIKYLEGK